MTLPPHPSACSAGSPSRSRYGPVRASSNPRGTCTWHVLRVSHAQSCSGGSHIHPRWIENKKTGPSPWIAEKCCPEMHFPYGWSPQGGRHRSTPYIRDPRVQCLLVELMINLRMSAPSGGDSPSSAPAGRCHVKDIYLSSQQLCSSYPVPNFVLSAL